MRGINDGPFTLFKTILSSKLPGLIFHPYTILAVILCLESMALLFTSTILVADLHHVSVVGNVGPVKVKRMLAEDTVQAFNAIPNPLYSLFGEVPSESDFGVDSRGLSIAGVKRRAFLPFRNSQNRTAVRTYHGNADVMGSNVACMRLRPSWPFCILTINDVQDPDVETGDLTNRKWLNTVALERSLYSIMTGQTQNMTFSGCIECLLYFDLVVNDEITTIYRDTLDPTRRAVLSLQTYTWLLAGSIYDSYLKAFVGTEEVQVSTMQTVNTLICTEYGCGGLISVATLLLVHVALVIVITLLFVTRIRYSRQSHVWHTVSQLLSGELKESLN
ncbi:Uu.00g041370.m01.CDS01 [Anthostomella pinea]|uniref:Uu.00g041370.m01.CDS01 n=1 Tax=Anthostomella pinea TaxID=933095 RepID=A0AAI8YBL9_9PEZI|nr:Uu.00g041370.m01.CDS01 [Anthostomella pinea]